MMTQAFYSYQLISRFARHLQFGVQRLGAEPCAYTLCLRTGSSNPGNLYKYSSGLSKDGGKQLLKEDTIVCDDIIYKFPWILHVRALARLKVYQTLFLGICLPWVGYRYSICETSLKLLTCSIGAAAFATITLFAFGQYFRRCVGIIAVSRDLAYVRVSHLTFWGAREDVIIPAKLIMSLADIDNNPKDPYYVIGRLDSPQTYLIFLNFTRSGLTGILNEKKFEHIFGRVS